jgi:hypothetical protein
MAISFVSDDDDTTEVDTPRRGIDTLQRQYQKNKMGKNEV